MERDDLAAATSSRSTKLIHGGVRYLEKAVKEFDRSQFHLVRDALRERAVLIRNAPHLCHPLPLVTPLYEWWQVPYYLTGLKIYDALAGRANLAPSRFVDAREALQRFPMLREEGLRGGVVYHDGQFDDARMNVAIALSAAERGAIVATHAEVVGLHHQGGRVRGATVRDVASGEQVTIAARAVLNATGPFVDELRRLDDPAITPMLDASSGVHIVLDARFAPPGTGLLIPQTEDGRVLFLLPWQGSTLVGTTDQPAAIERHPRATEDEIAYILRHVRQYFSLPVERDDVLAAWAGLRPFVSDPKAADTARLARPRGPRRRQRPGDDRRWQVDDLPAHGGGRGRCGHHRRRSRGRRVPTEDLRLAGAERLRPTGAGELQERGFPADVARHLHLAYGDRAGAVAGIAGGDEAVASHPTTRTSRPRCATRPAPSSRRAPSTSWRAARGWRCSTRRRRARPRRASRRSWPTSSAGTRPHAARGGRGRHVPDIDCARCGVGTLPSEAEGAPSRPMARHRPDGAPSGPGRDGGTVDARDLKSPAREGVRVRIPLPAPTRRAWNPHRRRQRGTLASEHREHSCRMLSP